MLKTIEYVDVTSTEEMSNPNERQKAALEALPKLEKFCAENGLSVRDIETLQSMLLDSVLSRKLKEA